LRYELIEQQVKMLGELDYMLFLTREGGHEKFYLFLLLLGEREIADITIEAKYVEQDAPKILMDLLDRLNLVYQISADENGDRRILVARNESDIIRFHRSDKRRSHEIYGYPETAVDSFIRNRDAYIAARKNKASYDELTSLLYGQILSREEHKEVLREEFSEYKLFWFLFTIAMSRDPVKREKELVHYRRWRELMKKYKII